MATKEIKKESDKVNHESVSIDIGQLYKFTPDMIEQNIIHSSYSNLAFIQVTQRDVFIDFYEMPGIKKDNKQQVPGVRVFMSHVAAQKMALSLLNLLNRVHTNGDIEKFEPKDVKAVKTSNVVKTIKKGKTI